MPAVVLVRGARQLVTLRGGWRPRRGAALRRLEIIPDGALLIRNGRIVEAGPSRRVENLEASRHAREINVAGQVVMPGFVDAEARLLAPDTDEGRAAASGWTPAVLHRRLMRAASLLLRHGTTTFEAKAGAGGDDTVELRLLRALRELDEGVWDAVPTFRAVRPERVSPFVLTKLARRQLAYAVEAESGKPRARALLEESRELGFAVRARGNVELALQCEADVAVLPEAKGAWLAALARASTVSVMTPAAPPRLTRTLLDRGAAVALGTGYGPGEPSPVSLPAAIARMVEQKAMTLEEAISAATVNGAHALGLAEEMGSLELGKRADLVALDCDDYRELLYHSGANLVSLVVKDGVVVYDEGGGERWRAAS